MGAEARVAGREHRGGRDHEAGNAEGEIAQPANVVAAQRELVRVVGEAAELQSHLGEPEPGEEARDHREAAADHPPVAVAHEDRADLGDGVEAAAQDLRIVAPDDGHELHDDDVDAERGDEVSGEGALAVGEAAVIEPLDEKRYQSGAGDAEENRRQQRNALLHGLPGEKGRDCVEPAECDMEHLARQVDELERQAEDGDLQPVDRPVDDDLHTVRSPSAPFRRAAAVPPFPVICAGPVPPVRSAEVRNGQCAYRRFPSSARGRCPRFDPPRCETASARTSGSRRRRLGAGAGSGPRTGRTRARWRGRRAGC